jgi:AcrR family transcriptional regulator
MIIGVASGLFATAGLRRTTMETIATAAGRGRRTIYMYFSNKAEVYEAVVAREISRITAPLKDIVTAGWSFEMTLHRYSEERMRQLFELSNRNPLLIKDFAMEHSRVEKLRERLNRAEMQIITPFLREHLEEEDYPHKATPEDYSIIFLNMLRGNDKLLTRENGYEKALKMSAVVTDLFIRGMNGRYMIG